MGPVKSRNAYRVEDAENEESSGEEVNPTVRVVASCKEVRQWNGGRTHLDVKRVVEDILGIRAKRSLKVEAPVLSASSAARRHTTHRHAGWTLDTLPRHAPVQGRQSHCPRQSQRRPHTGPLYHDPCL